MWEQMAAAVGGTAIAIAVIIVVVFASLMWRATMNSRR